MEDLLDHAAAMGLRVQFRDLGRRHGEVHSSGLVVINDCRPVRVQRIALAHECGHHAHGHDWRRRHDQDRDERQADTYAARLLVSPDDYLDAERAVGSHPGSLARELGVTERLILLWRADYLSEVGVVRQLPARSAG